MKKIFSFVVIALVAISCVKKQPSVFEQLQQSDPIKPVHLTDESTTIYLTDYVPTIVDDSTIVVMLDGKELKNRSGKVELLTSDNKIADLVIVKDEKEVNIPILPKLPRKQSFISMGTALDNISFGFVHPVKNPQIVVYWQNRKIQTDGILLENDNNTYSLNLQQLIKVTGTKKGRSYIRIYAADDENLYNDILLPLQDMEPITSAINLTREDEHAQVLYSLMVDRFENGNTQNDWKINSPEVLDIVDYQGGDIAGITKKIREGFFNDLGITTIWISPITQNPYSAWGYYAFNFKDPDSTPIIYDNKYDSLMDHTCFTGYHGYWPIYTTQIDNRLGTDEELKEMLSVAHENNLNVILDYVANHIHIESPVLQEHPDWITDSILPDGRRNFELWDEARLTTWFDKHIPTLDLEREEVYQPMTDSALHWIDNFDFDGFRHDACKHIPECYWRTLTQKMKQRHPDKHLWMIGETYGSPELIGSYVKTGMLDAQFDFNVFFTANRAIANAGNSMKDVNDVILESLDAYDAHHTMGNISGNHDQVRFISLAGGAVSFDEDGKEAGWTREVGVGDKNKAFRRAILLEVLNLTIPGVPCIYQGDEYGQAGGNDPDNRKMMRFSGLNDNEKHMREVVKNLITYRRTSLPLQYGDFITLYCDDDVLCFERIYLGQKVIVALNRSDEAKQIEVDNIKLDVEPIGFVIK